MVFLDEFGKKRVRSDSPTYKFIAFIYMGMPGGKGFGFFV